MTSVKQHIVQNVRRMMFGKLDENRQKKILKCKHEKEKHRTGIARLRGRMEGNRRNSSQDRNSVLSIYMETHNKPVHSANIIRELHKHTYNTTHSITLQKQITTHLIMSLSQQLRTITSIN